MYTILVGHGQGAEREALRRCEADAEEPVVKVAVAPLNTKVSAAVSTAMRRDHGTNVQARTERLQQITVLGRAREVSTIARQVPVGREKTYGVGEIRRPPDITVEGLGLAQWPARSSRNRELPESAQYCDLCATEAASDLGACQPLVHVKPPEDLGIDGDVRGG
jgi:hypothetical protein